MKKIKNEAFVEILFRPGVLGLLLFLMLLLLFALNFLTWISVVGGILILIAFGGSVPTGLKSMPLGFIGLALVFIDYLIIYGQ